METPTDPFEAALAHNLARTEPESSIDMEHLLRRARRCVAARNVLALILGRIWLALARLLAPAAVRLHRLVPPSRHP
ncbi:hypothetical protein [Thiobacter aerophilum]|uniref:Uncharacterized protein n=1 Tax=Thiobacter aerophilum TaxID=3121275 RepID=A0ABV0EGE6_9BURK